MKRPQPLRSPSDPADGPIGDPMSDSPRRTLRRRRRIGLIIGAVLLVVVLAVVAVVVAIALRVTGNVASNAVTRPGASADAPKIPDWNGPVNLLIMGSDGRADLTSGKYGDDDISGDRSDTLMLLHINAQHTDATLVSIPRDTMVSRPECTSKDGTVHPAADRVQINSTFDIGPYCTLDTVTQLTKLPIDNFVVVNFDGFIDITNAIGGVEVCLAEDVDDRFSGLHLSAGTHTIKGAEALAFVRTRHGIGDGSDLGRIRTQQIYLSALARKVKSAETLTNPVALFQLADAASRTLQVDEGLSSPSALVGLAGTLANVSLDRMVLLQLPVRDYPANRNRVEPIPSQSAALFEAMRNDRPVVLQTPPAEGPKAPATTAPSTGGPSGGETLPPDTKGQTADRPTCAG
ncbi:LCP family protein [Microbacterium sp.]|uniref:LCP family protein n=1 Tax=Microbacterium sp. TaxID=51671 RepID=UPI00334239FB